MRYKTILFDLDGTLTDPKEGITKSVQYALSCLGIEVENSDDLLPFIGPPLQVGFKEQYRLNEQEVVLAVGHFRERFKQVGMFENEVFVGVKELLETLKERGYQLAVATSKPSVFAVQILTHFQLDTYFDLIVGSNLDGTQIYKGEIIAKVMELYGDRLGTAIMIGDRKHDIIGAHENELDSIGVLFGYGSKEELEAVRPTYIVETVEQLNRFFE